MSSNTHVYVEGDVSIDPSAAIASGVILRAATDSKIIICAGVCIGIGSILHANQGILEVEAGANLGAGVLVVGKGKIGANACIGSLTTIWNASIEPWQVVPSSSLVGHNGRQVAEVSSASPTRREATVPDVTPENPSPTGQESLNGQVLSTKAIVSPDLTDEDSLSESTAEAATPEESPSVYGQGNLNRLLKTLFPYNNQSLNPPPEDG